MALIPCTFLADDDETTNFLNQALLRRLAVTDRLATARKPLIFCTLTVL
jgi:hypothetical protein